MDIYGLKFAGIPVSIILIGLGVWCGLRAAREWRSNREVARVMKDARRKFNITHEWQPRMINGVDCGEWVRKDGLALRDELD